MPYHLTTLLDSKVADAESFMTRKEAVHEQERRALALAEDNLRLQEEHAERLRRSVFDLDLDDDVTALFTASDQYSYRVDRCANSRLCTACLEAGFDQAEKWPRRGTDWEVVDHGSFVEIVRLQETRIFEDDDEAAAFVALAAQNPSAPDAVRRECLLALEEILDCASHGVEDWREEYGGPGRWQELLEALSGDEDPPCACEGTGFLVMNADRYDMGEALGEIQACDDCNVFLTDEDAADAARAAGYTVNEEGLVLSEPCRQRALRRWGV